MTHQVSLTEMKTLGLEDFASIVQEYVGRLRVWADHHKRVREDAGKPEPREPRPEDFGHGDNAGFEAAYQAWAEEMEKIHRPYPMDAHLPDVMRAVKLDENTLEVSEDYELVDDTPEPVPPPTAEEVLRGKKNALLNELTLEASRRVDAILPAPGRRPLRALRIGKIAEADARRHQAAVGALLSEVHDGMSPEEVKKITDRANSIKPEEGRPTEDHKLMTAHADDQARVASVQEQYADLADQVEDLTSEEIDAWKPVWKE